MSVEREVRGTADEAVAPSAAGVHEQLLSQTAMCEQFIGLLCQFERGAVLPFLQSHDSYRCYFVMFPCNFTRVMSAIHSNSIVCKSNVSVVLAHLHLPVLLQQ